VKRLIEFPLEDGTSMAVEVDEPGTEGMVRAARPGEITEKATQTFEAALERLKPAAAAIISQLRGVSDPPEQIGVEFGVKLSAGGGRRHRLGRGGGQLQGDPDLEARGDRHAVAHGLAERWLVRC
jgi:hypothetical protein